MSERRETTIRVRLARLLVCGTGFAVVPRDATETMVVASIANSLRIMRRDGVDRIMPDDPPPRPREVVRSAWTAMVEAADAR